MKMKTDRRVWKRISFNFAAIALCTYLIAGCSQPANGSPSAGGTTTISMMVPYWLSEPGKKNSEPMQQIQAYTKTDLNIAWVPSTAYDDKLSAAIAGQNLPEILYLDTAANTKDYLVQSFRSGMFWDIGPYLKDYPNLSKLNPDLLQKGKLDGKTYGIPVYRPDARNGIFIRKDWLDNLGLQEPKTLDDLIKVATAFAKDDPDKNGKNDTFAFSESTNLSSFGYWLIYEGGPNKWVFQNGQTLPDFMTKEYMDTLKLFKMFYDQHLINQDFAVNNTGVAAFNKGQAGMWFDALDTVDRKYDPLLRADPKAQIDMISRFEGPKGVRVASFGSMPAQYVFPKTSVKNEAVLKQLLSFLDKMSDPKMQDLFSWGIEGEHYKIDNGKPVRTDQNKYSADIAVYSQSLTYDYVSRATPGEKPPLVAKAEQMQKDNVSIEVQNPVQYFISPTQAEKGTQLGKIITDARTKFIMGQIDENGWNQAVSQWRSQGGDKIIQEYTDQYLKANPK